MPCKNTRKGRGYDKFVKLFKTPTWFSCTHYHDYQTELRNIRISEGPGTHSLSKCPCISRANGISVNITLITSLLSILYYGMEFFGHCQHTKGMIMSSIIIQENYQHSTFLFTTNEITWETYIPCRHVQQTYTGPLVVFLCDHCGDLLID